MKAMHKKTGKPYKIITDKFMVKQNGVWIKNLVLYETLYDNPDGKYFARTKEDFEEHFEIEHKPKWTEEDEDNLNEAIYFIRKDDAACQVEPIVEWLRTLKQRMEE